VFSKKQELLTLREHLSLPPAYPEIEGTFLINIHHI
jgi:hypothetical protein